MSCWDAGAGMWAPTPELCAGRSGVDEGTGRGRGSRRSRLRGTAGAPLCAALPDSASRHRAGLGAERSLRAGPGNPLPGGKGIRKEEMTSRLPKIPGESRRAGRRRGCPAAAPPGGGRGAVTGRKVPARCRWKSPLGFFVLCFQSPLFFFFSPWRLNRKGKKQAAGLSPSFRSGGSSSSSSSGAERVERRKGRSPGAVGVDGSRAIRPITPASLLSRSRGRIGRRRSRPRRGERCPGQGTAARSILQQGSAVTPGPPRYPRYPRVPAPGRAVTLCPLLPARPGSAQPAGAAARRAGSLRVPRGNPRRTFGLLLGRRTVSFPPCMPSLQRSSRSGN